MSLRKLSLIAEIITHFKQDEIVYLVDFGFLFLAKETKRTAITVIFYEPNFFAKVSKPKILCLRNMIIDH